MNQVHVKHTIGIGRSNNHEDTTQYVLQHLVKKFLVTHHRSPNWDAVDIRIATTTIHVVGELTEH